MKDRCQLCGGRILDGRCRDCGMDYTRRREEYRLNETRKNPEERAYGHSESGRAAGKGQTYGSRGAAGKGPAYGSRGAAGKGQAYGSGRAAGKGPEEKASELLRKLEKRMSQWTQGPGKHV